MKSDVNSLKSHPKVYIGIVHQLKEIISNDGLTPGDKLPSERELSERLNVGRSSVREALRALELLGLIETRRGEGTFLRDFREHHLIDLLGMFILEDHKTQNDILHMKIMIEKEALRALFIEKESLKGMAEEIQAAEDLSLGDVLNEIVRHAPNHLAHRIWNILNDYETLICGKTLLCTDLKKDILSMLEGIGNQDKEAVQEAYKKVRNNVDGELTVSNIFF
ncbi:GntR family transcriptional regulator [Rossellomorea marisflavi]|uniref:FadR/GntR family transcriptional regulator n=1 Tax=Rossellomorea marisflavi TaxID=189381 RepID=UPI001317CA42|nr:GntR family transcriptional regulator [Rossellomorea marisflavi]QHA37219.1 GntR family transcriptional regulator [Rossellomorea marisflavi]